MRNMVFLLQEVVDDPHNLDVWVIYQHEQGLNKCASLQSSLWQINFDPYTDLKNYEVRHSILYRILKSSHGK